MITSTEKIIVVAIVILFALLVWMDIVENRNWEAFKTAHHCRITAKVAGQTFNTFTPSSNGGVAVGIGSTGEQTGWTCDDGITYFK